MDNISGNYDEHDLAVFIACKKFDEIYPKNMQPEWLKYCMYLKANRNERKNWIVKMRLYPKQKIESNQFWRWMERSWEKRRSVREDGNPDTGYKKGVLILMQTDPVTGEDRYVPWESPVRELVTFFEVEVDTDKQAATVLTDLNPNKLDGTKYEMKISW